jgi:hypothetical protein
VEAVYQKQLRRASKILSFPSPLFYARPPARTSESGLASPGPADTSGLVLFQSQKNLFRLA